jgi:hypothetical protein
MKASELVRQLQEMIATHGDRDVFSYCGDECFVAVDCVHVFDDFDEPSGRDDQYKPGDFHV